jgi:DNA-binding response OmpR family regulator
MDIHGNQRRSTPSESLHDVPSVVQFSLGFDLCYDPALARIASRGDGAWLTPRENALLLLLLSVPYQWHQTGNLADLLAKRCGAEEVSLQSVRQTILGLRRKLHECGASPDLLRCRPGHGYGIFPPRQTSSHS